MKFNIKHLLALLVVAGFFANAYATNQKAQHLESANEDSTISAGFNDFDLPIYRLEQQLRFYQDNKTRIISLKRELTEQFKELAAAVRVQPLPNKVGIIGVPTLEGSEEFYEWLVHIPDGATGLIEMQVEGVPKDDSSAKLVQGSNRVQCVWRDNTMMVMLNGSIIGQTPHMPESGQHSVDEMLVQEDFDVRSSEPLAVGLAHLLDFRLGLTVHASE